VDVDCSREGGVHFGLAGAYQAEQAPAVTHHLRAGRKGPEIGAVCFADVDETRGFHQLAAFAGLQKYAAVAGHRVTVDRPVKEARNRRAVQHVCGGKAPAGL
jgi:hypothetical protein